jgi:FecR protein
VTTASDGRAEIQFDDGSVARIPPASSLTLSVLRPDGDTEIVLDGGLGYFELQGGDKDGQMRVRFGSTVVSASGFTVLRVKLDEGPPSVAVFSGNAHVEGPGGESDLHGGESLALNGAGTGDFNVAESIEPDSWDAWNSDRDQALTASETASTEADKNLPQSSNPAWGDLDANGTWYSVPDQGYVWSPYEASNSDWDPYGTGSWVWTPRFGYVWVSGERWGYMPYQCGAWNYYDAFGWGWAPGACQTWWGGGGGYGAGIGGGGGWYYTIGTTPKWYKLPQRPGPLKPRNPHPVDRLHALGGAPIVPVNRRLPLQGMPLPPRDRRTPVNIGGTVAAPLRPEPTRPVYGHQPPPGNGVRSVTGPPVENGVRLGNQRMQQEQRRPEARPEPRPEPRPDTGREPTRGNWPAARPNSPAPPPMMRPAPPPPSSRPSPPPAAPSRSAPPASAPSHSSPPPAAGHPK